MIEMLSILRFKFGLILRETEGFAKSIFKWIGLNLDVPSYSTLCRWLGSLGLILWQDVQSNDRIHGHSKRRTWRKLHLAVDEANNRILGVVLTTNDFKDNEVFSVLMNQMSQTAL